MEPLLSRTCVPKKYVRRMQKLIPKLLLGLWEKPRSGLKWMRAARLLSCSPFRMPRGGTRTDAADPSWA